MAVPGVRVNVRFGTCVCEKWCAPQRVSLSSQCVCVYPPHLSLERISWAEVVFRASIRLTGKIGVFRQRWTPLGFLRGVRRPAPRAAYWPPRAAERPLRTPDRPLGFLRGIRRPAPPDRGPAPPARRHLGGFENEEAGRCPDTRNLWALAPGSRLLAPGSRLLAPGSRLPAPGSRLLAPGLQGSYHYLCEHCSTIQAAGPKLPEQRRESGPKFPYGPFGKGFRWEGMAIF